MRPDHGLAFSPSILSDCACCWWRWRLRREQKIWTSPGFRLHPLKGREKGRWSVGVNGNWRLTFEFRDGQAYALDYEDYH